ncbi:MAG: Zn-ribbon domain-containing OB-fold protein [Methanothrix sp.]|nr:Zn-ribbon domain-containing OB-fold protein [Methanothrix sp.]
MTTQAPRFWRSIPARYNLRGTHCRSCDEYFFPPRNLCPNCRRGAHLEEHAFRGTGTVITYTTIYNATEDFDRQTPYHLAIIQLDEGPRITGQVVSAPEGIRIGMRVSPVFRILGKEGERGIIYYGTKFAPLLEKDARGSTKGSPER